MESLHTVRTLGARACAVKITITLLAMASSAAMADGGAAVGNPKESTGAIVGIVMTSARTPVAGATITASRVDGSGIRATISGTDGIYSFADVPSGKWAITAHVEGYADAGAPSLDVVASKAARFDVVMVAPPASAAASAVASAVSRSAPAPGASAPAPAAKPASPAIALGLQAPEPGPEVDNDTPFAFGDFTWLNGSPRNHAPAFDTKFFTPDIRLDAYYVNDYNHPVDHTIVGSTEEFRSGEVQLEQVSLGGDFHWENVRARFLSMFGLYSTTTPRNDGSSGNIGGVGQWDLQDAYRYFSEANAGYHWDVNHGLNVDAGIFLSYIGLFSYYNYDNWTYQPSYVSSNTPWFFNGVRIQWFPTNKLKIEPWIINGWQSYGRANSKPGLGGQILWRPKPWFSAVFNNYGMGTDVLGSPATSRIHTDDSVEIKYYDKPDNFIDKAAFTFTGDLGCESGGGVACTGTGKGGAPKQAFLGYMFYN